MSWLVDFQGPILREEGSHPRPKVRIHPSMSWLLDVSVYGRASFPFWSPTVKCIEWLCRIWQANYPRAIWCRWMKNLWYLWSRLSSDALIWRCTWSQCMLCTSSSCFIMIFELAGIWPNLVVHISWQGRSQIYAALNPFFFRRHWQSFQIESLRFFKYAIPSCLLAPFLWIFNLIETPLLFQTFYFQPWSMVAFCIYGQIECLGQISWGS